MENIGINPAHQTARSRAANLQAGAAVEDDHYVAAQGFGLLFAGRRGGPRRRQTHQDD